MSLLKQKYAIINLLKIITKDKNVYMDTLFHHFSTSVVERIVKQKTPGSNTSQVSFKPLLIAFHFRNLFFNLFILLIVYPCFINFKQINVLFYNIFKEKFYQSNGWAKQYRQHSQNN